MITNVLPRFYESQCILVTAVCVSVCLSVARRIKIALKAKRQRVIVLALCLVRI